jgi:ActR/RegA family two-component response regulator
VVAIPYNQPWEDALREISMSDSSNEREAILIVDDEEPVRRTFKEWIEGAQLGCRLLDAADAEAALVLANQHTIDLAILDWNLGAGNDGLRLLEDLYVFNPDVVTIMVTGYAHQATPLDAMRMGVRDYLDKNQDLNRNTFLTAVRRQLERVRPAKRERRLHRSLLAFREALEKVLDLAQTTAALNDPVPFPRAIGSLMQFVMRTTGARDGVLLMRDYDDQRRPPEHYRAYDAKGTPLDVALVPFARSLAGSVVGLQRPMRLIGAEMTGGSGGRAGAPAGSVPTGGSGVMEWQPFEAGRRSVLAAPMDIAPGIHAVLELFDKDGAVDFTKDDLDLVGAAADFGTTLMRQALAERQSQDVLLDAVAVAMRAGETVAESLSADALFKPGAAGTSPERSTAAVPTSEAVRGADAILAQMRRSLNETPATTVAADQSVRLAEAIRELALAHGRPAVEHCIRLVENLRELLDSVTGSGETRS